MKHIVTLSGMEKKKKELAEVVLEKQCALTESVNKQKELHANNHAVGEFVSLIGETIRKLF